MEQEYTTSTGYKIFYGIGAAVAIVVTLILPLVGKNGGYGQHPGIIALPVIGITGAIMTIINLFKRKATISTYSVKYSSIWGAKELANNDVKGYRVLDKRIVIFPNQETSSRISIRDYSSIGNLDEMLKELSEKYTNLDQVSYQNNLNDIYNNTELGGTKEERISKYNYSKKLSLIYNCGGGLIFIVSLIFTEFVLGNHVIQMGLILYPFIGILLMALNKGLIKLVSGRNSAFGSLVLGIYASTIDVFIIMIVDYNFVNFGDLILPILIVAAIIGFALWKYGYDKSENAVKAQIVLLVLIALFYACPVTILINCKFDVSAPKVYASNILNRHIMHNNGRDYCHVNISSWDGSKQSSREDLHINHELYDQLESAQFVHVNVKQGLLHVPWFYISQ